MLIEINLAPGGSSARARGRKMPALRLPSLAGLDADVKTTAAIGAVVVLLGLVLFGYWQMGRHRSELETRIDREVADSTRYAGTIALVEAVQARQDTVRQKIDVIRSVDDRRYVWPHLLDEISLAVPAYAWLTRISTVAVADTLQQATRFAIDGNVGSTPALTRFMKNLEASPFIRGVTLVTTEQEIVEGRAIQRFSLEANYEVPDPAFIVTVPVVALD